MTQHHEVEFLDTHQHLIYPDKAGYAWTDEVPALAGKAFSLSLYKELTASKGVKATIFMESGTDDPDYQREVYMVAELARDPASKILGIIASCRVERKEGFDAWLEECSDLPVVAFRGLLHSLTRDNVQNPVSIANARKIGTRGLVFDLCGPLEQMSNAAELVKACPDTFFMLDHCGVPDIAGGDMSEWKQGIDRMAQLPNVACKVSGVTAYCGSRPITLETLRPWLDYVVGAFGTDRLVWGSDWPVVNVGKGIAAWIDLSRDYLAPFSRDEQIAIASANAERIYKVG
ncbi:MAG TPA: amidohydrolase [Devosia sp.]|nr:amidohydrolase [Devosia sp.]